MHRIPTPWPAPAQKLFAIGGYDHMRVVGGYVRDTLLGIVDHDTDVDFATTHTPDAMMGLLTAHNIPFKPTGLAHGTITCFMEGKPYEITTLRRDVATDGRRAVVAFTQNWAEDAHRRDFTINALYADHNGSIIDETGQGFDDLASRRLRFIGDPAMRIREDYLRILRLCRFMAVLPNVTCDDATLTVCAELKDGLNALSNERVTSEWRKIAMGPNIASALVAMNMIGLDAVYGLHPDASDNMKYYAQCPVLRSEIVSLWCLFGDAPPSVFLLPNRIVKEWGTLTKLAPTLMSWQEVAYRYGTDIARMVFMARHITQRQSVVADMIQTITDYTPPICPITAVTIQEREGLSGPALGHRLRTLQEDWIKDTFPAHE